MKIIKVSLVLLMTVLFVGCGITDGINQRCGGDLQGICRAVFGPDNQGDIEDLEDEIEWLRAEISALQIHLRESNSDIEAVEDTLYDMEARLAELESGLIVTTIIDPCGDDVGEYDEILLVLSDGSIVAYFDAGGNKEFLSVIGPGNYRTTDKQKCNFTIEPNGDYVER